MLLYADEGFFYPVVEELRRLGHDVVTAQQDGHSSAPDPIILSRATALGRVLLTFNRSDFKRLHRQGATHCASDAAPPSRSARLGDTVRRFEPRL